MKSRMGADDVAQLHLSSSHHEWFCLLLAKNLEFFEYWNGNIRKVSKRCLANILLVK
jgi:hypothetical protein